jgi:ribosomal protein S27E
MIEKLDPRIAFRAIAKILQCPNCGNIYQKTHLRLLHIHKSPSGVTSFNMHSKCRKCDRSTMIDLFLEGDHMIGTCYLTDLTSEEAASNFTKSPITLNDTIEIHQALENFKGMD